ncbi:glycerate kinase [Kiritimatiella glycovorans]|uniref:Glycerate 2-kinase n=1 Tax=Kiritimatiella glycovorans TaxID=1307763 RepID=A0A0G3EHT8_9BACT|nr:glycerate kinase [Kiritimatiella glycovorans]AKJ63754.1 Glycerate 2-kinase [Kiritimatiella glycovorans]
MNLVVAFDSFKGTMSAAEACAAAADELRARHPGWRVVEVPMADGGEGTAEALCVARGGAWKTCRVTGPRPDQSVEARWVWMAADRTAVIEMAEAAGLTLLQERERDPLVTTTFGVGELMAAAAAGGAERIELAVGGSATVDGGTGAAAALGYRFSGPDGRDLPPGGGSLERLATIVRPSSLTLPPVEVLCDVDNPLCGPEGAAAVYAPQKGASSEGVARLERGLGRLAEAVNTDGVCPRGLERAAGAGAAGGLAYGAAALLGARLVSGVDAVMRVARLEAHLRDADWVLTGEGRLDEQSARGKVVAGVSRKAREQGARVAAVAGAVSLPERHARELALEEIASLEEACGAETARRDPQKALRTAVRNLTFHAE